MIFLELPNVSLRMIFTDTVTYVTKCNHICTYVYTMIKSGISQVKGAACFEVMYYGICECLTTHIMTCSITYVRMF